MHGRERKAPGSVLTRHHDPVTRTHLETEGGHRGVIVWFTGLSGAGKSTLARGVQHVLFARGCRTFVLDGDDMRRGLCAGLGFSDEDRIENTRRVGEAAKLFFEAGIITLVALISPFRSQREQARSLVGRGHFLEVYCKCPLAVCEARDVKGLYKRARAGEIKSFTGVSSRYEEPSTPELVAETGGERLEDSVAGVVALLEQRGIIPGTEHARRGVVGAGGSP